MNAQEKETVSAITNLLGTATGAAIGNSATDAASGSLLATNAVENNSLKVPNNTIEAKARQAILEGNAAELELAIETGGLIGEDLIIAQRLLAAMRTIGAEDAKFLASRYGVSWWNSVHHAFKGHSGHIGNQLLQSFGSRERAFVAIQKAVDAQKIRVSGRHEITVVVNGIRTNVRVYVIDGISTISTILKW